MVDRKLLAATAVMIAAALVMLGSIVPTAASGQKRLDDGRAGPGARWDPGMVLVKFRPGASARRRARILRRAGTRQVDKLPLVPGLYEVRVPAGRRVPAKVRALTRRRAVLYAQPDYVTRARPQVGPTDAAYWPNDPLFWPTRSTNPNKCEPGEYGPPDNQLRLGQWGLWRRRTNLTEDGGPFARFHPLPSEQLTQRGGDPSYDAYDSINVTPVWNLLKARTRTYGQLGDRDPLRDPWSESDIQRNGIAILDTGLSDHEDIKGQVAALFSVVQSKEQGDPAQADRLRQVFSDNPERNDFEKLDQLVKKRAKAGVQVQDARRQLFALDDAGALLPDDELEPNDPEAKQRLPRGCDGHGTIVGSIAAARANNGRGIAGVAYDAPLVGVRPGMPWDREKQLARNDRLEQAIDAWEKRWSAARTTEQDIHELLIVDALDIPVLNMSQVRPFVGKGWESGSRTPRPVLANPAVVEALARLLSKGTTLGVFAAGNTRQFYGSGPTAQGVSLYGDRQNAPASLPCGLKLIRRIDPWVGDIEEREATERFSPKPPIDWGKVNLLCVAATTSHHSGLAEFSGSGDAIVELAAPGQTITGAFRPAARAGGAVSAYANSDGTSLATPMVSGAASLLRWAAPRAPMATIAQALRRGARQNASLIDKVAHGQLDVACSLRWLADEQRRRSENWGVVDTAGDKEFVLATSSCGGRSPRTYVSELRVDTAGLYDMTHRRDNLGTLIGRQGLGSSADSNSMRWQRRLIGGSGSRSDGRRLAFRLSSAQRVAVDAASVGQAVYDAGKLEIGCPPPGYVITELRASVDNVISPDGWFFPTDAHPPSKRVELAFGLERPLFTFALAKTLLIKARVQCQYFPHEE